jgi:ABC-type nitrate/sulfonate/bicarbonate transport system substrate-binding protein
MTDLSPAAQAVKAAAVDAYWLFHPGQAAALLRAAADQLSYGHGSWAGTSAIIDEDKLLAIAAELENPSQPS